MKSLNHIIALVIFTVLITSCKSNTSPNYQYFPDMYQPVGYETYSESKAFANGVSAQLPVEGTIARGHDLYEIPNTNEGFALAKETLKNPLTAAQINLDKGKVLFDIYCAICHGPNGDGNGNLVKREKILGVPNYATPALGLTEGSVYHTIYYGKNAMGSYKNQLKEEERWQVVAYVMHLKANLSIEKQ